uniref:Inactive phospholipid phosphatase 7 n=1 Tax=Sus scrofa TaxID=9823 RepID=A0A480F1F3_PIG
MSFCTPATVMMSRSRARSRFMSTSWPASVLLFTRQRMVPPIQGMPWPVMPMSLTMERALAQDAARPAHTPRRLDMQMSMASRELKAMPLKEGFSCMQSSSGSCCDWRRSRAPSPGGGGCAEGPEAFLAEPRGSGAPLGGWFRDRNSARLRMLLRSRARARLWEAGMVTITGRGPVPAWLQGPSPQDGSPGAATAPCLPACSAAAVKYREQDRTWLFTSGCHQAPRECQCQLGSQSSPPARASANGATREADESTAAAWLPQAWLFKSSNGSFPGPEGLWEM